MQRTGDHAIVLGGSIAGILAARVLADRYARVTVVDRDHFPATGEHRNGAPQARHVHALLPRGKRTIDELFPGATEDLVERGALLGVMSSDAVVYLNGSRILRTDTGLEMLSLSRTLLEGYLRERLVDLDNVTTVEGCGVHGLATDAAGERVTGVRVLRRADDSAEQIIAGDLVVDATGRGSRTPRWLDELGYRAPAEERLEVEVSYTTAMYPRTRDDDGTHQIIVGGEADGTRGGAAIAVEDDRWTVTLAGLAGDRAPTDLDGFIAYAATLPIPDLHQLIRDREPLTEPIVMRYPASSRRHYEALERFPERLVVVGDALCSFNPVYAQGMAVAAVEAETLARCLDAGTARVGPRFFAAVTDTVDVAWEMAAGADSERVSAEGGASRRVRFIGAYLARLARVAGSDPVVAGAFLDVVAMVSHPKTLLHPRIVGRVIAGSLARHRRGGVADDVAEAPRASIAGAR